MAKILKKRSPNRRFARTIERRRLSKTLSDRRPPTLGDFVAAFFQRDLETASPLPPCGTRLVAIFSFGRSNEVATPTKFSSNAEKAKRQRLFFAPSGYNKRYSQRLKVLKPIIFRVDGDAPP